MSLINRIRSAAVILALLIGLLVSACSDSDAPTPTSTVLPTVTPQPTATPAPTETLTPIPSETPEPTPEPTATTEPSPTTATNADIDSACPVASDESYGYEKGNAIRVGGDFFDGAAREREYLDTLRGPDGQIISYVREGSLFHEDVILDAYAISYSGLSGSIILYLDLYTFEELFSPVGFTCDTDFSLQQP